MRADVRPLAWHGNKAAGRDRAGGSSQTGASRLLHSGADPATDHVAGRHADWGMSLQEVSLSMSYRCEVCGKEPWFGKQVSFSHKRSSRRWLPNIQKVRVKHGSNSKRVRVCTSCIKAGKIEKV